MQINFEEVIRVLAGLEQPWVALVCLIGLALVLYFQARANAYIIKNVFDNINVVSKMILTGIILLSAFYTSSSNIESGIGFIVFIIITFGIFRYGIYKISEQSEEAKRKSSS
jgi:hypothetical protein